MTSRWTINRNVKTKILASRISEDIKESIASNDSPDLTAWNIPQGQVIGAHFSSGEDASCSDSDEVNSDSSVSSINSDKSTESMSLDAGLLLFMILFSIPRHAMQYLLTLLAKFSFNVPKTVYLLKKSQHHLTLKIVDVKDGKYAYIGIRDNLELMLTSGNINIENFEQDADGAFILPIDLSVDGLPLYRSSSVSLWPILLRIHGSKLILPVACFCGIGKPNLQRYSHKLVAELKEICQFGFRFQKNIIKLCRSSIKFICDAPAKAFLMNIKSHTAKLGCSYCRSLGSYFDRRVIFSSVVDIARSDFCYLNTEENNQLGTSPLAEVVGLYNAFVPDYMHCVCLGMVRKLFFRLFRRTSRQRIRGRIRAEDTISIDEEIEIFAKYTPTEFQRRVRSLSNLEHFKATEFRQFLLYFSPFIFKKYLAPRYYDNMMLLHFAIYVFSTNRLRHLLSYAHNCIQLFVEQLENLYGRQSLTYNAHTLLHLHEFVEQNGPLDQFSAFPFENYLGKLKRRIKKTRGIFQHSLNQMIDLRSIHTDMVPEENTLYFSSKPPNNCCVIDEEVVLITAYDRIKNIAYGIRLTLSSSIYEYPCPSERLGLGIYQQTKFKVSGTPMIKMICVPRETEFMVMPFVM